MGMNLVVIHGIDENDVRQFSRDNLRDLVARARRNGLFVLLSQHFSWNFYRRKRLVLKSTRPRATRAGESVAKPSSAMRVSLATAEYAVKAGASDSSASIKSPAKNETADALIRDAFEGLKLCVADFANALILSLLARQKAKLNATKPNKERIT
jgi:hypothetical protein